MLIQREQLVATIQNIPAFPQSVRQLIILTSQANCYPKQLVEVIERDPVMTIKVLKLVNSAYFGLSQEVMSVQHSVAYVGLNTVKNIAISVAMAGVLPETNEAGLDIKAFWKHSLAVGVIANRLAERQDIPVDDSAGYFVAGLIHNIGQVLFAHYFPQEYRQVLAKVSAESQLLHQVEQQLLGVNHCQLGALLAKKWQLPEYLIACIEEHHAQKIDYGDNYLLKAIIGANHLYQYIYVEDEDLLPLPAQVQSYLGASLEELRLALDNLDDDIKKSQVIVDML